MRPAALQGKVALVTGAGREPARSLALALAERGVGLALSDLTPMGMEETAALAASHAARITCHVADPSKSLAAAMLIDEVLDAWESIDILVLHPRAEPGRSFLALDEWNWQRTLETNLNGPFLVLQQVARLWLEANQPGVCIHLIAASSATSQADPALHTSQAGLRAFTEAAGQALAGDDIRVYAMAMRTPSVEANRKAADLCVALCEKAQHPAGTIFELDG